LADDRPVGSAFHFKGAIFNPLFSTFSKTHNATDLLRALDSIIKDEEHHRERLSTVKQLLSRDEKKKRDSAPEVKYQSPDLWIRSLPSTT